MMKPKRLKGESLAEAARRLMHQARRKRLLPMLGAVVHDYSDAEVDTAWNKLFRLDLREDGMVVKVLPRLRVVTRKRTGR